MSKLDITDVSSGSFMAEEDEEEEGRPNVNLLLASDNSFVRGLLGGLVVGVLVGCCILRLV